MPSSKPVVDAKCMARRFEFVPWYWLRGLKELHLEFTATQWANAN